MEKLARFIVKRRIIFVLLFVALIAVSFYTTPLTKTSNSLMDYLGEDTETHLGLKAMENFTTFGSARVMFSNVTLEQSAFIKSEMLSIPGVKDVEFDDTEDHYKDASMLFNVTFEGEELDDVSINALEEIKTRFANYDIWIHTTVGNPTGIILSREMNIVLIIIFVFIILMLALTSRTWMEIPILLATFGAAAMINNGTNFFMGTISFITDSIDVVLQLSLAIDYAIIMCHRYTEERELYAPEEACIKALAKAIPEISASSLTTISGLLALAFMDFNIGIDMSKILIKSILISLLSVFLFMPGLLVMFSSLIDKTHHRKLLPNVSVLGKFAAKTKYIIPLMFIIAVVFGYYFYGKTTYVYGYENLDTMQQNEVKKAEKKINSVFAKKSQLVLVYPTEDLKKDLEMYNELEKLSAVDHLTGLSGITIKDGYDYTLTSSLTPRQFSEVTDISIESVRLLYSAYFVYKEQYGKITTLETGTVPVIDMLEYLHDTVNEGYLQLSDSQHEKINDVYNDIQDGKMQLMNEKYSRIILYLDLPDESNATYDYLEVIRGVVRKYYTEHYLVGETTKCLDLKNTFSRDNTLIGILTIVFVILVLLFTFKSVALPILLIVVIQGAVWINFSFPYLTDSYMFFLAYLIVSALQMGANIDYAIVISSRYLTLKKEMSYEKAMQATLNQAFPTILTSGCILMLAGFTIFLVSSDNTVAMIGECIGRGTLISIILVLFVLPQILLFGDLIIEKTIFGGVQGKQSLNLESKNAITISGHIKGYVNGYIDADIIGSVSGTVNAFIATNTEVSTLPGTEAEFEISPTDGGVLSPVNDKEKNPHINSGMSPAAKTENPKSEKPQVEKQKPEKPQAEKQKPEKPRVEKQKPDKKSEKPKSEKKKEKTAKAENIVPSRKELRRQKREYEKAIRAELEEAENDEQNVSLSFDAPANTVCLNDFSEDNNTNEEPAETVLVDAPSNEPQGKKIATSESNEISLSDNSDDSDSETVL